MSHYTHLSITERRQLYIFLEMKLSIATIAKRLGRSRSTLYREQARNKESDRYLPVVAQRKAQRRKSAHRYSKLQRDTGLAEYVRDHLQQGWSPEQIAGRRRLEGHQTTVCTETIYRYIYQHHEPQLHRYLACQKPKRRPHSRRKTWYCRYGNIRSILQRPQHINTRHAYGHWEGDTMIFQQPQRACVTTLVERKSRLVYLLKNNTRHTNTVMGAIRHILHDKIKGSCRTITFDQGTEFADFRQVEQAIGCKVYYCQPHSPWQKGSNENMNGRVRRYLPRETAMDTVTQEQLDLLAERMNNQPRKCLGFRKPIELFSQYQRNLCRTWR